MKLRLELYSKRFHDSKNKKKTNSISFHKSKASNDFIISDLVENKSKNLMINNDNKIEKLFNLKSFTDYELNSMQYKKALKNDKRTYFDYYFSLLKTKHLLLFSFFQNNDYNSKDIKIILFFFLFHYII